MAGVNLCETCSEGYLTVSRCDRRLSLVCVTSPISQRSGSHGNICYGVAVHPVDYIIKIPLSQGFQIYFFLPFLDQFRVRYELFCVSDLSENVRSWP